MSLFDTPKPYLNPILWTPDERLKSEVKTYILDLITKIFPLEKIHQLAMIGSNVGHQYSATSDIDVNLIARKGEIFEAWHPIFKAFNDTPNLYPGTKHPINFFFQEHTTTDGDWSNSLGAYNIMTDTWEKRPIPFSKLGDPEEKYINEIAYGKLLIGMIESEVRNIIQANELGQIDEVLRRAHGLAILFKSIEDNRKQAYKYHIGTPALQECNILYKMIEDSTYSGLFKQLINMYDKDWKAETEDTVKTAGKLKEDAEYAWYVAKHKANIIPPMVQMGIPLTQALKHDLNKFTPSQFGPYRDWFESSKGLHGTKDPKTYETWRQAVQKHYSTNMHHWHKMGLKPEQVPLKYRMESVADWYSVGKTNRRKGSKFPSFSEWYAARRDELPIDKPLKNEINNALGLI